MKKLLILMIVALTTASSVGCGCFDWLTGRNKQCGAPPSQPQCGDYYGAPYAQPGPDIYNG